MPSPMVNILITFSVISTNRKNVTSVYRYTIYIYMLFVREYCVCVSISPGKTALRTQTATMGKVNSGRLVSPRKSEFVNSINVYLYTYLGRRCIGMEALVMPGGCIRWSTSVGEFSCAVKLFEVKYFILFPWETTKWTVDGSDAAAAAEWCLFEREHAFVRFELQFSFDKITAFSLSLSIIASLLYNVMEIIAACCMHVIWCVELSSEIKFPIKCSNTII